MVTQGLRCVFLVVDFSDAFQSTSATGVDVSMDKCRLHGGAFVS